MSIQTKDVYTCDACGTKDYNIDNGYQPPLEWFTIRISMLNTAVSADDLHICASCKYEDINTLWQKI